MDFFQLPAPTSHQDISSGMGKTCGVPGMLEGCIKDEAGRQDPGYSLPSYLGFIVSDRITKGNRTSNGSHIGSDSMCDDDDLDDEDDDEGAENDDPFSFAMAADPGSGSEGCSAMDEHGNKKTGEKPRYKHVPHREKPPKVVEKRNERERRRVQTVNSAFVKLRKYIPYENRHKRLSKVKTLRKAIEYIDHLQSLIQQSDAINPPQSSMPHPQMIPLPSTCTREIDGSGERKHGSLPHLGAPAPPTPSSHAAHFSYRPDPQQMCMLTGNPGKSLPKSSPSYGPVSNLLDEQAAFSSHLMPHLSLMS